MMKPDNQQASLFYPVVAHYVLSAACFVAMAVMLLLASEELQGHYFHPKLLAITHTAALGWGTLIIFGACYQLLPVILETALYSHKLCWISLSLFFTGLLLLVYAFWQFDPGLYMQMGSLLLLAGISLFGANAFLTAKTVTKQNIYHDFIITACIWLVATAVLGVLMVFNFRYPFLPQDHLQFLKLHAHMGIGGWFLLLIVGVSAKLIPMFLVSTKVKPIYLTWSYYLINSALLLFLADTYWRGINETTYLIATLGFAGIVLWFVYLIQCIQSRMRKSMDLPMWQSMVSFVLLTTALVVLPLVIYYQLKSDPLAVKHSNLYGTLLFMGWISALILGKTFKTLPFIVWVKCYQHLAGKEGIPLPADLIHKRVLRAQVLVFSIFNLCFYAGLIFQAEALIKAGLICFLLTSLLYILNVVLIVLHKPKVNHAII